MELRLDDPKSKEDDMGVILVDVCLMFRDATIKKGPVRVFLIWILSNPVAERVTPRAEQALCSDLLHMLHLLHTQHGNNKNQKMSKDLRNNRKRHEERKQRETRNVPPRGGRVKAGQVKPIRVGQTIMAQGKEQRRGMKDKHSKKKPPKTKKGIESKN